MKRILATLLALLQLSVCIYAEPKATDEEFEYTPDGVITAYYGEEFVYVPSILDDGTEVREIGDQAFFDIGISAVYLGEGITTIGTSAFEGSNVTYVDFSDTVYKVEDRAFANCTLLEDIVLKNTDVSFGRDALSGTGNIVITVPCNANPEALFKTIRRAKGDDRFEITKIHFGLTESETEKDLLGEGMLLCDDCGYKESRYYEGEELPFKDIKEDSWYRPYVTIAYSSGILNGKSPDSFDPDAGLTCAEAAKIAASIHAQENDAEIKPSDEEEEWYDRYIAYCVEAGILEKERAFHWDKLATRAEMAYFFARCSAETEYLNDVPITDIPDVNEKTPFWYEITELYDKGIAVGNDEKLTFNPYSNVKRSEAATLVSRILFYSLRIELPKG